ncbi:MAG: helix-turn-helix domain-containing protein [Acidiferrobacterales bacterium]|nr:helix-turn-helix domain-containing protein [Acidiferrobacterales bacterium]
MTIRQRRLEKGWSQLQLAEFSGLSLRTIQRIEKGHTPTLESLKCIAALFEIDFNLLVEEESYLDLDETKLSVEECEELKHIRGVHKFLRDLLIYLAFFGTYLVLNMIDTFNGEWLLWTVFIWGIILIWRAYDTFDARDFLGKGWEKRDC